MVLIGHDKTKTKTGTFLTKTETETLTTKNKTETLTTMQDQDRYLGSQDQDFQKTNLSALETKTLVSRTTSLDLPHEIYIDMMSNTWLSVNVCVRHDIIYQCIKSKKTQVSTHR